ncbi:hypothetical protein JX265_000152 [Neoarthrinium moseri]|uniref:DUF8212 domain-containing protein n=1 Tax=Neoarthrinium moseri TaxID=1658444 RepID=A0A9Q0AVA7_9PEZI|nr:hypothetical protein JX265_000152 [Neoarthrinium moseri]
MSWAAGRQTEKEEDRAYSLLGMFNIYMPVIYGEGIRAFTQLQEEIVRASYDHSIFAWNGSLPTSTVTFGSTVSMFAETPDQFSASQHHPMDVTNAGLHIELPLFPVSEPGYDGVYYACIACTLKRGPSSRTQRDQEWPVIYLYKPPTSTSQLYNRVSFKGQMTGTISTIGRQIKMQLLWVSPYENVLPLRDLPIKIVDAWTNGAFVEENKLELHTHPGTWAMKPGRQVHFPSIKFSVVARRITVTERLFFRPDTYQRPHCLSTMIIGSDNISKQVLAVVAIGRGAWYLFLSILDKTVTAEDCFKALLQPGSGAHSGFIGCGIPFSADYPTTLNLGQYHVTVQRDSLGHSYLAFRIIFGTGTVQNRSEVPIACKQHFFKSVFSMDLQVERLRLA